MTFMNLEFYMTGDEFNRFHRKTVLFRRIKYVVNTFLDRPVRGGRGGGRGSINSKLRTEHKFPDL